MTSDLRLSRGYTDISQPLQNGISNICYMELLFRRSDKAYGISIVLVAICAWKDFVFIEVHIIRINIVVGS